MVFTLHRYIFRDLLRTFFLASAALTVMLSLGSMIGPIQKFGVSPGQIVRLLGYFMPITLTFVLPMAALFSAALVYGRFASDNELDACKASGVSMMTMVYPGLCLAIVVAITTLVLSFHVVPAFVHRAEEALQGNVKQILFRNIEQNGYYKLPGGRYRIYANRSNIEKNLLMGIVITDSEGGKINNIYPADAARIEITSHKGYNRVSVVAMEAYQDEAKAQNYFEEFAIETTFPPMLSDNIKFQKIDQIKEIKADMMQFYPVRKLAEATKAQLGIEMLNDEIAAKISEESDNYYQLDSEDRIVMFTAASSRASGERTIELIGPIRLFEYDKVYSELICQWDSNSGKILLDNDESDSKLIMDIDSPTWQLSDGIERFAQQHIVKYISFPEEIARTVEQTDVLAIKTAAALPVANPTDLLQTKLEKIHREVGETINQITAEIHSRLVFGLGCITLVMISIALGILLKGGHLLSAFGASSIPAGVLIVCLMAGKNLTKAKTSVMADSTGIIIMWAGLAALTIFCLIIYRKLTKI